jgi:hypothetical protein
VHADWHTVVAPLGPPGGASRDDDGTRFYVSGRHRSQAMLDASVRRTLVAYWDWPAQPSGGR